MRILIAMACPISFASLHNQIKKELDAINKDALLNLYSIEFCPNFASTKICAEKEKYDLCIMSQHLYSDRQLPLLDMVKQLKAIQPKLPLTLLRIDNKLELKELKKILKSAARKHLIS